MSFQINLTEEEIKYLNEYDKLDLDTKKLEAENKRLKQEIEREKRTQEEREKKHYVGFVTLRTLHKDVKLSPEELEEVRKIVNNLMKEIMDIMRESGIRHFNYKPRKRNSLKIR